VSFLAKVAALATSAILLWAALEKARDLSPTAATIRRLGVPGSLARPTAFLVTAAELVVAVAILFRPDTFLAQAGIVALAGLFALAGWIAWRRGEAIPCNCFGAGSKDLGASQMLAFLPWLAAAGVLRLGASRPTAAAAAAAFAVISLFLAAVQAFAVRKAWIEARGDRRSAQETYPWLPSR
jgi:hypothetical protein